MDRERLAAVYAANAGEILEIATTKERHECSAEELARIDGLIAENIAIRELWHSEGTVQ